MNNPKECFCLRQRQTFFVLNELTLPECKDGSEPLTFHHETFSRFKFVIINADKKATTANIPVHMIPDIIEAVKMKNFEKYMAPPAAVKDEKASEKGEDLSNNIAYTTVIGSGTLRGKTPAGALLENPDVNHQMLVNQINWLKSNLAKYPRNQAQIDAITEALRLYKEGKLSAQTGAVTQAAPTKPANEIYKTGMRPLTRRKNQNGKTFVYEIAISWNPGSDKPVEFEIRNYFAPVVKRENGLLNVIAKDREGEVKNVFALSLSEWFWLSHILEAQMRTFEDMHAARLYKTANEDEWANRSAAGYQPSSR